jgi:predicted RNA-binding Zn ribbon-like protein
MVFVGNHPAVDFLNTAYAPDGRFTETIGSGREFLEWMVGAGLLEEGEAARVARRLGRKELDQAAAEARRVREWGRSWLDRWRAAPRRDYGEQIAALNRLLAGGGRRPEVVATPDGLRLIERTRVDSAEALLSLVAGQIAELITEEEPSLVRSCEGPGCTLWFLDRTRAHRRRFCSAAACGNRAKVAAWRERQRG